MSWHEIAKTNISFDIQILKMKSSISCYIVIHFITIKSTQTCTNQHNYLKKINIELMFFSHNTNKICIYNHNLLLQSGYNKQQTKNQINWILHQHILLKAPKTYKNAYHTVTRHTKHCAICVYFQWCHPSLFLFKPRVKYIPPTNVWCLLSI